MRPVLWPWIGEGRYAKAETARLIDNFCAKGYTKIMIDHSTFAGWRGFELSARKLAIGRGGRTLAAGLEFTLHGGEALVVTGPNGAGKSTLLRSMAGLLTLAGGEISVTGDDIEAETPPGLCAHYLGHADAMKGALSVRENLVFWASMLARGQMGQKGLSTEQALAAVGLPHIVDFPAGYLSAGQKRRIAMARLLVAPRPLWLLDEPTTALDAASQQRFAGVMREHLARGGAIVAATHAPLGLEGARELRLEGRAVREPAL